MAVTAEQYQRVLEAAEALPPPLDSSDLDALTSIEEVVAFVYREFSSGGDVEAALDWTEMLIRSVGLAAPRVREMERTLRLLGFGDLASRLRQIAGKRKHGLRPLESGHTGD